MKIIDDTIRLSVDYLSASGHILTNPASFFAQAKPFENFKAKLLFALPPVFIYSLGLSCIYGKLWYLPALLLISYLSICLWAITIRFVLSLFAEKHSFEQVLHVTSTSSIAFLVAWIPYVGSPVFLLWTFFLNFAGLVHFLKINKGAALAALAFPVIVLGVGGGILSYILLWAASITTLFNH